jgi:alanine racemase
LELYFIVSTYLTLTVIIFGIYTKLHNTANAGYTKKQLIQFNKAVNKYSSKVSCIYYLNSTGVLNYNRESQFDNAVRVGAALFGFKGYEKGIERVYEVKAKPIRVYEV